MKTIKISKKSNEVISTAPLNFISGGTSGNDLYVVVRRKDAVDLIEGGKLLFEKVAAGNSGQMVKVYEEDTKIKAIVNVEDYAYVYFDYVYIQPLTLASFRNITSSDDFAFKLYFTGEHHMLPCDIDGGYKIYIRRGEKVVEFSDLAFCYPGGLTNGAYKCNCSGHTDDEDCPGSCECCNKPDVLFNYETMERNSILSRTKSVTAIGDFEPEPGDQVLFATNPFFHIENGKINLYSCQDGCPPDLVTLRKYTDFMDLGVVMEQDYDAKRMFQEYQVNELFVNKIKNSIIPDFIDLEKVKYAPAFFTGQENDEEEVTMFLATGLTFNLHFRTRVSGTTDENVPEDEAQYYFDDTWHFNDGMDTWNANGMTDSPKTREQLYSSEEFVNSSNLIGYLGFTDDDIYNQKNRVKQSFIRLSFYDDKNPLTQNLLCYSTIFLDSGDLYGKYVKRKAWLEETIEYYDPKKYPVVWSSARTTDPCSAVTSQLIVNDEYDMTRSGEGFNIYLFREDAPIENYPQDIYMKVEFNHAGIGRTVPLIRWPKEKDGEGNEIPTGEPEPLNIRNYLDNLYIRVRISLSDRGYVYDFPDAVDAEDTGNGGRKNGIVWENERLVLNLFEPMIEPEIEIAEG